jgi:predicted outer membrane protein
MKKITVLLMFATSAPLVAAAHAQQAGSNQQFQPPGQQNAQPQGRQGFSREPGQQFSGQGQTQQLSGQGNGMQSAQGDAAIAGWLLVGNLGEVEAGKLAEQRASNDDVKKFAREMVQVHSQLINQLSPVAGPYAAAGTQQNGGNQNGGGPNQMTAMGQGNFDLVRIKQQIGQQCVASTRQELESKQGSDFDKCYIGKQIGMHQEMLDTLKVMRNYASPQLQQMIAQATATTQQHLDHAKSLMHQLESKSSKS